MAMLLAAVAGWAQLAYEDFTVIVLPDTQNYSQYYPEIFAAQTQWIAAQREARNIQLVLGVGDVVNDGNSDAQWQNADAAVRTLDAAGIPYVIASGNHDYDNHAPSARVLTKFNQYFGPERYATYPWYQGNYPAGSNENLYAVVTVGGQQTLVLVLEFVPRDATLEWARQVLAAHNDKQAIVVTHSFVNGDNTRVDQCDTNDLNRDNDGEETWAKLLSGTANVFLVVNGHLTLGVGRRTDVSAGGTLVHQMLADYQSGPNGGDGHLRILTFHPLANTIDVETYSPVLDLWLTDPDNRFTLKWRSDGVETGTPTVNGKVRARTGTADDCRALADASIETSAGTLTTDGVGNFTVATEVATEVMLTVRREGYWTLTRTVATHAGYPAEADFFLQPVVGSIAGRVKDAATGTGIPGATVTLTGGGLPTTKTVKTSAVGDYSSGSVLPVGEYQISVSASGYTTGTLSATATANTKTIANVALQSSTPPPPPSCASAGVGVTICAPTGGDMATSPFRVNATAQSDSAIQYVQIYLDGVLQQTLKAASVDMQVSAADGAHRLTVQAKDAAGKVLKNTVNFTVSALPTSSTPPCATSGVGVTICAPANGDTVTSPVMVKAAAQSSVPIQYVQIYVDGVSQKTLAGATIEAAVPMAAGTRRLTVQAKDANGTILKSTVYVAVQ